MTPSTAMPTLKRASPTPSISQLVIPTSRLMPASIVRRRSVTASGVTTIRMVFRIPGKRDVPDVVVNLYECTDGQAIIDQNKLVRTTTTDDAMGDMNYMFGAEPGFDLVPGEYFVQFIKPGGSQFTTPKQR